MKTKSVLVTGANGYIGNAVAKAFSRAGWKTFGLVRRSEAAAELSKNEIIPLIGSPEDLSFLKQNENLVFDVIVSNTEDQQNPGEHLLKVEKMIEAVASRSNFWGIKPLVMFSSGCKDYGFTNLKHGDPALVPQTEDSSLSTLRILQDRCNFSSKLLSNSNRGYDATVLRPTIVYGLTSSYYGRLFDLARESKSVLQIIGDAGGIMHSCHVEDCAEAYVAIAGHPDRDEIAGQAFNISNHRYETVREVGEALAVSYGLQLELIDPEGQDISKASAHFLANSWQWVSSEKVRSVTGWKEKRIPFAEGIDQYRMAYEASRSK